MRIILTACLATPSDELTSAWYAPVTIAPAHETPAHETPAHEKPAPSGLGRENPTGANPTGANNERDQPRRLAGGHVSAGAALPTTGALGRADAAGPHPRVRSVLVG